MNNKKIQLISFSILLVLISIVVFLVFRPFINIIALAAIFAILFYPVFLWINGRVRSRSGAAALTLLIVIMIFLVPLSIFGQILWSELYQAYNAVSNGGLILHSSDIVTHLPVQLQGIAGNFNQDISNTIARITGDIFQTVSSLVSNVATFILSLFLSLFTLFYLLRDGENIKTLLMDLSPMNSKQEGVLVDRVVTAINGVVKGSFLVALTQGVTAVIGFVIFGVPQPLLWGMFTVVAALVPTIGTALSLTPAVLYLFLTGHTGAAIGLAAWGVCAVGLIDNLVSPRLIGSRLNLHPLLVLFSIVGGVAFFGFLGFLIGPILIAIFMAMVDIYRSDFKKYMEAK